MNRSKLTFLFRTFSEEEIKEFSVFIQSGFFNREKAPVKLFTILKNQLREHDPAKLDKKKIYSGIFPGKPYNDALMRNTISDLLRLAERYLIIVNNSSDDFLCRYQLLKELTNRKQKALFNVNLKKAKDYLKETDVEDEIHYQQRFLIEDEKRRNVVVNSSKILYKEDNLNSQAENLRIQHLIENIKLYAIMLNQNKFTHDHNFDFSFFEIITDYIGNNYGHYKKIPYIMAFYNCVMLFKTGEDIYFNEVKNVTEKYYRAFTLTDRKNLFVTMTSHINFRIKSGDYSLMNQRFEIYKEFIRTGAYLEGNNFMAHYIYQSAVLSAIEINKLDWAERFITKYKMHLHEDFRESTFNYCYAYLNLYKKKYQDALEQLSNVDILDIAFRLNINNLLTKIFFCMNQTDSLYFLIDSYRHLLKRNNKIRKEDVMLHNNFIKYLKRSYAVMHAPGEIDVHELIKIKNELISAENVFSKRWLIEQISTSID